MKRTKVPDRDYIIRPLRFRSRREAELMADMVNRSDQAWPGSLTGGVPLTAERARQNFMVPPCYGQWVAEHAGEIVGCVSLLADPSRLFRSYLGLITVRPDHHGQGVGRRLLRRALDRAIKAGFEQVELDTWSGNVKAVPLYKKTGFFWSPASDDEMHNLIPTIVRMPLLADFFRRHDWYEVQQRELHLDEDVERWHGIRAFRYRFAADDRRIEVLIDCHAERPTAVETNELAVAAWIGAEDLAALQEHTLHYEVRNKTDGPLSVRLRAKGDAGVPVKVNESFELPRGRTRQFSIPFRLPADLERKPPRELSHRVISTITVNGVPVRLETAVRMRPPVEIDCHSEGLPAGKWTGLRIKLRNWLPFAAVGRLSVDLPPEVECDRKKLSFRIPRGGWGSVSWRVRPSSSGAWPLKLRVHFGRETARRLARGDSPPLPPRGRERTVWLRALVPGVFVTSEDRENRVMTVESDRLVVQFHKVDGELSVRDRLLGRELFCLSMPSVGPPFGGYGPTPRIYDVEVQPRADRVNLITRQDQKRLPGLTLERTLQVMPGLIEVRHRLLNASDRPRKVEVRAGADGGEDLRTVIIPDEKGLLRHRRLGARREWPTSEDLERSGDAVPETWVAAEEKGTVVGVVWEGARRIRFDGRGGAGLTYKPLTVPAGGTKELPPIRLVMAAGDYRAVRAVWSTYVGPGRSAPSKKRQPSPRKLVRGGLSQVPVLLTHPVSRLALELTSERKRPINGAAELTLPSSVALANGSRKRSFPVHGLRQGSPVRPRLTLARKASRPTAGVGELRLLSQRESYRFPVPVIIVRSGRGSLKLRHDEDTVSVDTGWAKFLVSAAHGGSMVSLKRRGRELLHSSYPTVGPYYTMNPWYGGVRGFAGKFWNRQLQDVRRRIKPVRLRGASGSRWEGAQVTTRPNHPDWRWLRHEVQYLGTPGSNLVAVRLKVTSTASAATEAGVSIDVWPRSDAGPAYVEQDGQPRAFQPDVCRYTVEGKTWLAFDCGRGNLLAMVTPPNSGWQLTLESLGNGQFRAPAERSVELSPSARSVTSMLWLVPCRSVEEAHAYRFLAETDELP